jgi:hypothetical protein
MVRQVDKLTEVRHPEGVPNVPREPPKAVPETLVLNLFDIDPHIELEKPRRIDLDLDQLEDEE